MALEPLNTLRHIDLLYTKVTAAGVEKLHKALPQCEIIWDGGTIKPVAYIWPKDQPAPAIAPFKAEQAKAHQEAWAKHLGIEVETTNSIGMKFRVIPPGEFLMGSSDDEIAKLLAEAKEQNDRDGWTAQIPTESPQHRVTLTKPFGMSIHEVTSLLGFEDMVVHYSETVLTELHVTTDRVSVPQQKLV